MNIPSHEERLEALTKVHDYIDTLDRSEISELGKKRLTLVARAISQHFLRELTEQESADLYVETISQLIRFAVPLSKHHIDETIQSLNALLDEATPPVDCIMVGYASTRKERSLRGLVPSHANFKLTDREAEAVAFYQRQLSSQG